MMNAGNVLFVQYRFENLPRIACSTEALSSFITATSQFKVGSQSVLYTDFTWTFII